MQPVAALIQWRGSLGHTRRSTRGEQPDEGVEVDEKKDQIALRRIVAGREILRNDERNSNSPETGSHVAF